MEIFNFSSSDNINDKSRRFEVGVVSQELYRAMDGALLRDVTRELATKIVEEIYPDIIKAIDKELIVKEVAMRVSDEVIQKLFSAAPPKPADSQDKL